MLPIRFKLLSQTSVDTSESKRHQCVHQKWLYISGMQIRILDADPLQSGTCSAVIAILLIPCSLNVGSQTCGTERGMLRRKERCATQLVALCGGDTSGVA